MGFAFGHKQQRAELMMSHCGVDLNTEWLKYMEQPELANTFEFKVKVAQMSVQVLEALNTLHQVGYCHWDIKLDNVCYYNGTYNLIDFAYA